MKALTPTRCHNKLSRGVLVLLICVRILVCLDCSSHSILIVILRIKHSPGLDIFKLYVQKCV